MEGYRAESYGDRLADVYDDWYPHVGDVDATIAFLDDVARRAAGTTGTNGTDGADSTNSTDGTNGAPDRRAAQVLELAAGTGRLAIPLAGRGHQVSGLDVSEAMLARLRTADPEGLVSVVRGDMVDDLPPGPFDMVFVAYNSLFMLTDADRQAACFRAVAPVLSPGGVFVVEAFVPDDPPRRGQDITIRSMTADRVVLTLSIADPESQQVTGQFVELTHGEAVRLRPWCLRYTTPRELDDFARRAGLSLVDRFADVSRTPFDDSSATHVSVYGRLLDDDR